MTLQNTPSTRKAATVAHRPPARHPRHHGNARLDRAYRRPGLAPTQGRGDLMPRFQTDDNFHDDPAVIQAGTAAMGLYYRCGIYVAEHLLDGRVPAAIASQYGTPEWIRRLTDAGLWETEPGGQWHYMPLYFAHANPTKAKVLADREAKAQRQKRWLESQRNPSSEPRRVSRRSSRASPGTSGDAPADVPLPPSLTGRKGARARAPRDADGAPGPPLLNAVDDRHAFEPDTSGDTCVHCDLPKKNQRHREAS